MEIIVFCILRKFSISVASQSISLIKYFLQILVAIVSSLFTALLISLNTFSSHVVIALALPLLNIFHTTSMMEMDGSLSNEDDFKGEIVLQRNSLRSNGILVKSLLSYLALRMLHVSVIQSIFCPTICQGPVSLKKDICT